MTLLAFHGRLTVGLAFSAWYLRSPNRTETAPSGARYAHFEGILHAVHSDMGLLPVIDSIIAMFCVNLFWTFIVAKNKFASLARIAYFMKAVSFLTRFSYPMAFIPDASS